LNFDLQTKNRYDYLIKAVRDIIKIRSSQVGEESQLGVLFTILNTLFTLILVSLFSREGLELFSLEDSRGLRLVDDN
jgi:hypothetical protein